MELFLNFRAVTGLSMPIDVGEGPRKRKWISLDSEAAMLLPEKRKSLGAQALTLRMLMNTIQSRVQHKLIPPHVHIGSKVLLRLGFCNACAGGYSVRPSMKRAKETAELIWTYRNMGGGHTRLTAEPPENVGDPLIHDE